MENKNARDLLSAYRLINQFSLTNICWKNYFPENFIAFSWLLRNEMVRLLKVFHENLIVIDWKPIFHLKSKVKFYARLFRPLFFLEKIFSETLQLFNKNEQKKIVISK